MSIVAPRPATPEPRADETHVFVQAPCVCPERGWGGGMCGAAGVGVEPEDAIKLVPLSGEVRVIVEGEWVTMGLRTSLTSLQVKRTVERRYDGFRERPFGSLTESWRFGRDALSGEKVVMSMTRS